MRRLLALLAAALAVPLVACGDDGGAGTTTTTVTEAAPADYSARGPYAVGELELHLDPDHLVVVLYPVDPGSVTDDAEPYSYSGADLFDASIVSLLPDALAGEVAPPDTWVGLPASGDGPFPVVLHSHGFGSNARFSSLHQADVASWGYVVVAVDHPERGVVGALTGGLENRQPFLDTEQLLDGLDLVTDEASGDTSPIAGAVDPERVAAEGHSAGGGASGAAAYSGRVDLWLGQAPGMPIDPEIDLSRYETDTGDGPRFDVDALQADTDPPPVPSMIIAAEDDTAVELDGVEAVYDWLAPPKRLAVLAGTGHNVFTDPCREIRAGGGLSEFVENLGLDPDSIPLVQLGEDGCLPDDPDPETIWPVIDHLTVAQLEAVFGDQAVGEASLDADYLEATFPGALSDYRVEG